MTARKRPDRRVARTRRALQDALIAEILVKGYDAVTVQDILDRADVGRSTFYAHFDDKQALLVSGIAGLRGYLASHRDRERPLAFSLAMFEHVEGQRELGRATFGRKSGAVVHDQMRRMAQALVRDDLAELAGKRGAGPVPIDAIVEVVVGALLALLAWWLDHRVKRSAAELDAMFRALVMPGVEAGLGRRA